jgi:ADP-ribose pyrophosphatase YjhB (NUDIX family)
MVRAVIQHGEDVLCNVTKRGPRLLGGRVKPHETLREALQREIQEEVGLRITVRDLVLVRERTRKSVRELTLVYRCFAFGDLDNIKAEKGIKPRWVPKYQVVNWSRAAVFLAEAG